MRVPAAALAVAVVLAGCLGGVPARDASRADLVGTPVAPFAFHPAVAVSKEWPGSEPVVAVASDGTLFVEGVGFVEGGLLAVNKVFRSRDGGATWMDVTPEGLGEQGSVDGFVAVGNGDRVYAQNSGATTFQLFRSDDLGESWIPLPAPKFPVAMHRSWIVPEGAATLHVVYEALPPSYLVPQVPANPNEGLWYFRSDDRGLTWSAPRQIDPIPNFAGQGNLVVANGSLYVPRYVDAADPPRYERGQWYLIASEDEGRTWERREMFALTSELAGAVLSLAADGRGVLHFAWAQAAGNVSRVFTASSADGGRSWSAPFEVSANGTQALPWIAARGDGEATLVWYEADAEGLASRVDAPWHVVAARVAGAHGEAPAVARTRVTADPVHEGNICAKGPACRGKDDRRLLDYPWVAFGPEGEAHLVFASTMWKRPSAFAIHAREALAAP
ncbi:MAG TPA: sialidase family protein [Candidatus Thermoplasmatota archaeon]|nr:sialidase family protein [Candidatus Thermoplasmatota archaeon]